MRCEKDQIQKQKKEQFKTIETLQDDLKELNKEVSMFRQDITKNKQEMAKMENSQNNVGKVMVSWFNIFLFLFGLTLELYGRRVIFVK